jgi:hypothetical protein
MNIALQTLYQRLLIANCRLVICLDEVINVAEVVHSIGRIARKLRILPLISLHQLLDVVGVL